MGRCVTRIALFKDRFLMKLIRLEDSLYEIIYHYPNDLPKNLTTKKAKERWNCDTILRGPDGIYMVRLIIDAEFEDIE